MPFADADVFDESEDLGIPGHRRPDVGHGQNGRHARVRRRPVGEHPARLDRQGHRAQNQPAPKLPPHAAM